MTYREWNGLREVKDFLAAEYIRNLRNEKASQIVGLIGKIEAVIARGWKENLPEFYSSTKGNE
jgi:hypothetical protein